MKELEEYINIKDFKDGHAYYVERKTGRIAVADMGRYGMFNEDLGPVNTEDGVLYLDFTRDVKVYHDWDGDLYHVPLTPDMGETYNMVVSQAERKWIGDTFNW